MQVDMAIFSDLHILILGDVMIDQYMHGNVYRQSPEADIPVLEDVRTEKKLGGAANVAKNIHHLGAKASLLSVCGEDSHQDTLQTLLKQHQIEAHIIADSTRQTTVKTRVFADKNQLIRVDQEDKHAISEEINHQLLQRFEAIIEQSKIDILILQDYNKGVLHQKNIGAIIQRAQSKEIFIAVDPKVQHFYEYEGVDLFKPNMKELFQQFPSEAIQNSFDLSVVKKLAKKVQTQIASKTILVTLSEHGAMLCTESESYYKAAKSIEVVDVCGAGDAVIAVIAMAMYKGIESEELLDLCNETGRIVCEKTGVASIHISELKF